MQNQNPHQHTQFGTYGQQPQQRPNQWQGQRGRGQFGTYGQGSQGQFGAFTYGQGYGAYGQGYGSYGQGFGGPQTEDYEIAEFWYIPGTGQMGQGQGQSQGQMTNQGPQQMRGMQGRTMQQGPHTGKGPKRSNEHIDDEVRRRLTQHPHLDASNVDVKVNDGVVTLTGTVNSRQEKREAENVADSVPGVKDVHNELTIQESNTNQSKMNG